MNANHLLDAFGLIDDRFIIPHEKPRGISLRRSMTLLIAAVVAACLCIGTAMAVSDGFRAFVFSVFRIGANDTPPAVEETAPSEPGLHGLNTVSIDGQVSAWYFSSGGYLAVCDGGFYTSEWAEAGEAPMSPAFWRITFDGIEKVQGTRVDFSFTHSEKTWRILFDYAVVNGRLAIRVWPEDLDLDPIGNGWNAEPLGSRTDAVVLTIPVLTDAGYTHHLFVLDLKTLEAVPLITDLPLLADGYQVTADLRYAVISGCDPESGAFRCLLYDLQRKTAEQLAADVSSAWFLDDTTLIFREELGAGRFRLIRCHLPTGVSHVVLENVSRDDYRPIRNHWAEGRHCLLSGTDGAVSLVDLRTGERLELTGLSAEGLTCCESPDGSRIMLGHTEDGSFTSLGILDPQTGILTMLDREVSGCESFGGWLDSSTLVVTTHAAPDAALTFTPGDGYDVYVYRFLEPQEPPAPTVAQEPADDAFVRVADHIPDIAVELRYAAEDNFTGEVIYDFSDAWLRYGTVKKLMQVQEELRRSGLRLKIWDGFRPVSAQFRLWEICPDSRYVADPNEGFSSHSRGGTVDVTLVYADGSELKMPTGFDDFSALADRDYGDCPADAARNAGYLEALMSRHGFIPYRAEWWHYTDADRYQVAEDFQP